MMRSFPESVSRDRMCRVLALVGCLVAMPFIPKAAADRTDEALLRGSQYLLTQQDDAGAISNKMRNETAMTSLAILALASVGHQPGDATPEGRAMRGRSATCYARMARKRTAILGCRTARECMVTASRR